MRVAFRREACERERAVCDMTTPKLRVLGFCGADDSVHPEHLALLSQRYPWIEWGVLFRPDLEGQGRYASEAWVESLSRVNGEYGGVMELAAHLCAARCQEVLEGDADFVRNLRRLGFGRIQINATAANKVNVDADKWDIYAGNILSCLAAVPEVDFIFQLNDETRGIWNAIFAAASPSLPKNLNILFDASCGLGILATEYPAPLTAGPQKIPSGYAGGIGPNNISEVLASVGKAAGEDPVWVDMESSLRLSVSDKANPQPRDVFSLDKCFECVLKARHLF